MKRDMSMSAKVRRMIDKGYTNKAIIEKLGVKPQAVYNIRYQINKARGLGAIGALPKPTDGIGEPPKRKRKVRAGTGITSAPPVADPAINSQPIQRPGSFVEIPTMPVTMFEPEPKPTLWGRIKRFFKRG